MKLAAALLVATLLGAQQTTTLTPLRASGAATVIELGAVHVAANGIYPGPITVGSGGVPTLTSGMSDIATNAETQLLRESVINPDLRVIFTIVESHYRIVARKSQGIKKLADLKGKRIAVPRNTSANYFLYKMLATAKLTEADITFAPATDMTQALVDRKIDAIAMWDPETAKAAAAIGDDAITFQDPKVYRELFNLNTTSKVLADPEKRRAVVQFVRSLMTAIDRMKATPQEFWSYISTKVNCPVDLLEKSWPELHYHQNIAPDLLKVMVEEEKWVAKERNRTPRTKEQLAMLIDDSVLKEARQKR
ncbi:MAG: ABC transporter substrate-binding protein [Bryobacteraceae bacterium]